MKNKIKIAVAGTGYVGMSLAALLAQHNSVTAVDVVAEKVDMINRGLSPIADREIEKALASGKLDLKATLNAEEAYKDALFVVIAVPTNYDEKTGYFDTHHIEDVVNLVLSVNPRATMVIKSTIPIGYTAKLRMQLEKLLGRKPRIIFAPEFLREGRALLDNLYPSRIIVGYDRNDASLAEDAVVYGNLVRQAAMVDDVPMRFMGTTEAEAVKLFANSYLAMRVAYFNELDSYAEVFGLNAQDIIEGVCLDGRIGEGYNNPSFGYGGYCFPKDTKQLRANFYGVEESLVSAIVESNAKRKSHIADMIANHLVRIGKEDGVIGFYRLAMKSGSDNARESAVWDIMRKLYGRGYRIVVYEPSCGNSSVLTYGTDTYLLEDDFERFKDRCALIVANRMDGELESVAEKVYTRDIYRNN